jgi:hypothetical protein
MRVVAGLDGDGHPTPGGHYRSGVARAEIVQREELCESSESSSERTTQRVRHACTRTSTVRARNSTVTYVML